MITSVPGCRSGGWRAESMSVLADLSSDLVRHAGSIYGYLEEHVGFVYQTFHKACEHQQLHCTQQ